MKSTVLVVSIAMSPYVKLYEWNRRLVEVENKKGMEISKEGQRDKTKIRQLVEELKRKTKEEIRKRRGEENSQLELEKKRKAYKE